MKKWIWFSLILIILFALFFYYKSNNGPVIEQDLKKVKIKITKNRKESVVEV